jgi:hypothetical protein
MNQDKPTRAGDDRTARATPDDDGPVLPDVTSDERGTGWGDEATQRDDDWYRSERPPHHGG